MGIVEFCDNPPEKLPKPTRFSPETHLASPLICTVKIPSIAQYTRLHQVVMEGDHATEGATAKKEEGI